MFDMVGIQMRQALGSLRSVDATTEGQQLRTDLSVHFVVTLRAVHKIVVNLVATTDDLNIVNIMRVDSGQADTAIVHLTGENFVSEEVVSEKCTVRVGVVEGISHGDINEITKENVHRVVLFPGIIEMSSILVDSV